ncbi:MAG: hypothetical protein NVS3B21_03270 [Acidimicrobiales bacterium]
MALVSQAYSQSRGLIREAIDGAKCIRKGVNEQRCDVVSRKKKRPATEPNPDCAQFFEMTLRASVQIQDHRLTVISREGGGHVTMFVYAYNAHSQTG